MENNINYRQQLGKIGEDLACSHLEGIGHTIIKRNYRSGHCEIDIISRAEDGIHFVEVKTRKKNIQAPPQDNVNDRKQKMIVRAALGYLKKDKDISGACLECHFDVVAVTIDGDKTEIGWIPDAYIPLYT